MATQKLKHYETTYLSFFYCISAVNTQHMQDHMY